MTHEAINRAIAELCDLKAFEQEGFWQLADGRRIYGYHCGISENHAWAVCCPNYYGSLNACAEFEQSITDEEDQKEYAGLLHHFTTKKWQISIQSAFPTVTATAPQRCEAFLRLHNRWEEV